MEKKTNFLMVDDDVDERKLFTSALNIVAPLVQCTTASNGNEAITILNKNRAVLPDLIFLDINMPVMTGWECLTKIVADHELNKIPVIMYSTSSNPRDIDIAFQLGATGYCVKGEDFTEVKKMLDFILTNYTLSLEKISRGVINGVYFKN